MSSKAYMQNLTEARVSAAKEADAIYATAVAEKRDLTGEETEQVNRINAAIDTKAEEIRDLSERDRRTREADEARAEWETVVRPDVIDRRESQEQTEIREFLAGERRTVEFSIREVARERQMLRSGIRGAEFRILQEDVAASGGTAVPTGFVRQLYDFLEVYSGMRQTKATIVTTASGEALQFPKVTTHGTAALVGEGTAIAANDAKFGQLALHAWKYGQLVQVSHELISDAGVDVLGFVAKDCGRALGRVTDTAYVSGSGSSQPQGLKGVIGTGVTSQTAATGLPSFNDLVDLVYSINQEYRAAGAEWLMKDASAGSIRKIRDSQNRPLWEPSYQVGQPDMLLGYPVRTDPNMAAFATAAATGLPIFFGDFSPFYIRDVETIRFERSDDFAFDKDLVTFRCVLRTDSNLIDLTGAVKALANPST